MKIYVVTAGEYSYYHIELVTTNKELAEAYCKIHNDSHTDIKIEEFDDYQDLAIIETAKKYRTFYDIEIRGDGKLNRCNKYVSDEEVDENGYFHLDDGTYEKNVVIDDEETATKIAYDERAKVLAKLLEVTL